MPVKSDRERARAGAWATFFVKTDPRTGLHAEDCSCRRCEEGHRPTTQQRAAALESRRRAAAATVAREKADAEERVRKERESRSVLRTIEHVRRDREDADRALAQLHSVKAAPPPVGGFAAWLAEQKKERNGR